MSSELSGPVLSRKQFLVGAAGTGAAVVGATWLQPVPALGVPAQNGPPGTLNHQQTDTLVAWCDLLVPGAEESQVGRFVNTQLRLPHEEAKLMVRYVTWPPPYDDFYRGGLTALDGASEELFGSAFLQLTPDQRGEVRDRALDGTVSWSGPPAGLFYFVTRGDGVDVVYGTPEGFERIAYPYQALAEPRRTW